METELFTNEIEVNAPADRIRNVLANLQNILKWDREIIDVNELKEKQFMILRSRGGFSREELISVVESDNQIVYESTNGKIEYSVVWSWQKINESHTELRQSLIVNEKNAWGPIAQFIRPVMQTAFYENLRALKVLSELEITR